MPARFLPYVMEGPRSPVFYLKKGTVSIALYRKSTSRPMGRTTNLKERLKRFIKHRLQQALVTPAVWKRLNRLGGQGIFLVKIKGQLRPFRFDPINTHLCRCSMGSLVEGHEPIVPTMLYALLKKSKIFWDVGSNWGQYSILAASLLEFTGEVHAFEPFPTTYAQLLDIVTQLGLSSQIHCHNVACSNKCGSVNMFYGAHSGSNTLSSTHPKAYGALSVTRHRLDDLDVPVPDFIKLDVERHEIQALQGAENHIREGKPHILFESHLPKVALDDNLAPFHWLKERNYQLFLPVLVEARNDQDYFFEDQDYFFEDFEWLKSHTPCKFPLRVGLVSMDPCERTLYRQSYNFLAIHNDRLHLFLKSMTPSSTSNP